MATLDIRSVRKSYGFTDVIHGIDLRIEHGDFAVILGPSGCGKSTLLRMIAGLEAITGGEIAIDGKVVNALEPRERDIAMVFQNYALYPHMSVAENMSYALRLAGAARALVGEKVGAVARILGLEDLLARRPGQLSGGQRQRVAMGRAIIREPKVFLFDEPLSNLDAKLRNQMRTELKRLHLRLGATSILVTHDQVEAMSLANRLIVMNGGRVEQVGAPGEVYARPATLFVAGFIGSLPMNFFTGTVGPDGRAIVLEGGIRLPWRGVAGQEITVGIRPDAFAPADDSPFGGTIDLVEDLGSVKLVHVGGNTSGNTSGNTGGFVVALPPDSTPAPGDAIGVAVKPKDMHVFDTESGARLQEKDGLTV